MNTQNINELISLYNQQVGYIKEHLTNLLVVVSDGRIPSKEELTAFDTDMEKLCEKYDGIYAYTRGMVSEEELPPVGSSVIKYADAFMNSKARFFREQMDDVRRILIKFISIKSMLPEYTAVLQPYQDSATELLNQINETTIDAIIPKTEASKVFLAIMEVENINSAEGIKLLEQVSKHYPMQVQWGLAGKQYYFEQSENNINIEAILPNSETAITEDALINEQSLDETTVEKTELMEGQAVLRSDMLKAVNKVKRGTPSATSFRKEIIKLSKSYKEVRAILPLLTNLGSLTKEQFYLFGVCMDCFAESDKAKNSVDKTVEALVSKGYLACFEYEDESVPTVAYCLSKYCYSCMYKDSIALQMKGFWDLSYGAYKCYCESEVEKIYIHEIVRNNSLLLKYVYAMKGTLGKEDYQTLKQSIKWKGNHYQIMVFNDNMQFDGYLVNINTLIDIEAIEEPNLLFCDESGSLPSAFNIKCERVFVLQDGNIRKYDVNEGLVTAQNIGIIEESEETTGTESVSKEAEKVIPEECVQGEEPEEQEEQTDSEEVSEDNSAENATPASLLQKSATPSDDEFCQTISNILHRKASTKEQLTSVIVQAVLLAKSAGWEKNRPNTKKLSAQLQLATGLMLDEAAYTSENLAASFMNPTGDDKPMMLAAYLFAMLAPATAFDYGLKNQTERFFSDYEMYFGELSVFKPLFNKIMQVRGVSATGFSPATIALLGSDAESEKFINEVRREAKACLAVQTPKTRMKALPIMYNACFGVNSDLYECLSIITDNKKDKDDLELVSAILSEYCDAQNDTFIISEAKIENQLNKEWDNANLKNKFKLEYDARDQAIRQFRVRIDVMLQWVEHISSLNNKKQDLSRLMNLKREIIDLIQSIQKENTWKKIENVNVLSWMLQHMQTYLSGQNSRLETYSELLFTGIIGMNNDGSPNMDVTMTDIRFYEPWRNAVKHLVAKKCSAADVRAEILGDNLDAIDDESGLKDNLHQLEMLGRLLGSTDEDYVISEAQMKEAIESADERTTRFRETLELAYTYNQINETEKETLAGIMVKYKGNFYGSKDFACWRHFLGALEEQIKEFAAGRKEGLRAKLDSRLKKNTDSTLLKEADRLLEKDMNFAVTEEYINRFDSGETELDDELELVLHEQDYFGDFLSKSNFERLLLECRKWNGYALKTFGWNFLEKNLPKEWTSRLRDDSKLMVTSWPSAKDTATPAQIQTLFTCLGFDVMQAFKIMRRKEEMFQVVVEPTAKSMANYRHPITAFGTQIKTPINVIILYGNHTERQLVDTISSLDLRGISVVLIDRPIDAAGRRLVGEIFHTQTSGQNPFLLIDQVLFLYLAMHQVTERLPALLKCTLPYTTYQPFVRDGGSTADEMFCGRTQELATIIDPNGACVVYGGRQLGKTALLERAESRCSKPENKVYAVYSTIIRLNTEAEVVGTLTSDIEKKTDGRVKISSCKTLRDMCEQLSKMFRSGQIASMHLLIDEVDDFLTAIAEEAYRPIQPLVDLKRETKNNFKFVIAGLHNVCRAKNATRENGIFGQLGTPLCIKPLSPTDALKLLSRPLNYLGFQIDRYPHLETILTNTNYYPGILQFFGYMLVETLIGQYSKYYHAADGNPPFTLQDEQLGAVMNSSDLNKSIKDKFRWSLELDPRYFMIARCITMLYHFFEEDRTSGSWLGFKVDEIIDMATTYEVHCLENESKNGFINLLDEMVEMGILSQPMQGLYRLRRGSFVDIIGETIDTLEADIINNNEEV